VSSLLSLRGEEDFPLRKGSFSGQVRLVMVAALEGTGHSLFRDCRRPNLTAQVGQVMEKGAGPSLTTCCE